MTRSPALKNYLNKLKRTVDKGLDRYLPSGKEPPRIIHMAMRYSVFSGGKRIRPIIALESCKACGGDPRKALIPACAIEMVHTYSLVHDDLPAMDDDNYRRGRPACHKVFKEENAILAGDALLTLAFNILSQGPHPGTAMEIMRELSDAIGTKGMVGGQSVDLEYKGRKKDRRALQYINRLKTSRLFEASARIGAIEASAGTQKDAGMARFGAAVGMAFQITDDIIDGEGYAKASGRKGARSDAGRLIRQAKRELNVFGRSADRLREIADYVLARVDIR